MSDPYQITLGIGTPASIPRFILFGLSVRLVGVIECTLPDRELEFTLPDRDLLDLALPDRNFMSLTLKDR